MAEEIKARKFVVSSSPHLVEPSSSRRIMYEVFIGMLPAIGVALYHFRDGALMVLISCIAGALATEAIFNFVRKKAATHFDGSALVTAVILALSLPPTLLWYQAVLGSVVAISVAKMLFGGLGSNIFNPAMVGRAFLMASFGGAMTTWVYTADQYKDAAEATQQARLNQSVQLCSQDDSDAAIAYTGATEPEIMTGATLLDTDKKMRKAFKRERLEYTEALAKAEQDVVVARESDASDAELLALKRVRDAVHSDYKAQVEGMAQQRKAQAYEQTISSFMGSVRGSAGETSALAWLIGGLFLLVRRTITWHIPVTVLLSAALIATIAWLVNPVTNLNPIAHLSAGGLMMCAFFIATDPVTCPLSRKGRLIFGVGVGSLIMIIRLFGALPEGAMYAVLVMNSLSPLLDRFTKPVPMGGNCRA